MKKHWLFVILVLGLLQFSCGLLPIQGEQAPAATVTATPDVVPSAEPMEETPTAVFPAATETQLPPTPTSTMIPTATAVVYEPVLEEIFLFKTQEGSPMAIQAWTHDCSWLGVAGQVFSLDGYPINDLVVEAGGEIGGQQILGLALTGRSSPYGEGGYEVKLLDAPVTSKASAWVQLKDVDGNPLSPKIFLETGQGCEQNLILINFVADEAVQGSTLYIPLVQP